MARDQGGPKLAFQLMLFPVTNFQLNTPSMDELGTGYTVSRAQMESIIRNYLPNKADITHPYASPILATSLANLPPALIITAEYDPLHDDGELYGKRLQESGVPTTVTRYDGMIHDFPDLFEGPGNKALSQIASALQGAFGQVSANGNGAVTNHARSGNFFSRLFRRKSAQATPVTAVQSSTK